MHIKKNMILSQSVVTPTDSAEGKNTDSSCKAFSQRNKKSTGLVLLEKFINHREEDDTEKLPLLPCHTLYNGTRKRNLKVMLQEDQFLT